MANLTLMSINIGHVSVATANPIIITIRAPPKITCRSFVFREHGGRGFVLLIRSQL